MDFTKKKKKGSPGIRKVKIKIVIIPHAYENKYPIDKKQQVKRERNP